MSRVLCSYLLRAGALFIILAFHGAFAATQDMGNGFFDHGVAAPFSAPRGIAATVDGSGRDIALIWLMDHRGGYALLSVDTTTGKSEQFPLPFLPAGDAPYASILSSRNKFYTHFNSHFVEFDTVKRAFSFCEKTTPQMAMSMTEDDHGTIWSATYPQCGIVSFNPSTRELKDYGNVYSQEWAEYPRSIATDDAGWVYIAIGSTATQIITFDPNTGKGRPIIPEAERVKGYAYVYRDLNGKVYGQWSKGVAEWCELYRGEEKKIGKHDIIHPKPIIAASQGLFHRNLPDGKRIKTCNLIDGILAIEDPKTGDEKKLKFSYENDGAAIMGISTGPHGSIWGGTMFPMRSFSYNPAKDEWTNRECYGQWNTMVSQGEHLFVGGYGGGFLLEWNSLTKWVPTEKRKDDSNPIFLTECAPSINRPSHLVATPDGKLLILSGTPDYGYTGGGLLFWDRTNRTGTLIEHTDIIPEHSTASLLVLPNGKLLGGTTTSPGTGGEKKAAEAQMYLMDMATKKVEWHQAALSGIQEYTDLCSGPNGLVYGVADRKCFFVFDPATRKIIHTENINSKLGLIVSQQGPRVFVTSPDQSVYMLFVKGIAVVDPKTFDLKLAAASPVLISAGGDILNGRIYFGSGSHVFSYTLPAKTSEN